MNIARGTYQRNKKTQDSDGFTTDYIIGFQETVSHVPRELLLEADNGRVCLKKPPCAREGLPHIDTSPLVVQEGPSTSNVDTNQAVNVSGMAAPLSLRSAMLIRAKAESLLATILEGLHRKHFFGKVFKRGEIIYGP